MTAKYALTGTTKTVGSTTLYQIQAGTSFGTVSATDLGGYIATTDNLSLLGNCWVDTTSMVYGTALVTDAATIIGSSVVADKAVIAEHAIVEGSIVRESARVEDYSHIKGCEVWGSPLISMVSSTETLLNSMVYDQVTIEGRPVINKARLSGNAVIQGTPTIGDGGLQTPHITGSSLIDGSPSIKGGVKVSGSSVIRGTCELFGSYHADSITLLQDSKLGANA